MKMSKFAHSAVFAVASALSIGTALPVAATTLHATSAMIVVDGPRGTANDRDDITNSYGAADGAFFELGYGAVVDFYFGANFISGGAIIEVTGGNRDSWLEAVIIQVGTTVGGVFTQLATASPNPFFNNGPGTFTFAGGSFDTIRLIDVTLTLPPGPGNSGPTGGFDVDSISVSPVPLPAGGLLLIGALGGLAALRRRKTA
jgi:hypothetical protein